MKFENGVLSTTIPGQFDGQIHSVEWFHNGEWRRISDTVYPLQDSEILDDTLDCGGFCFTNELKPYPDEWMTDKDGKLIKDENGKPIENQNSIKFLKQLTPIRILWDSEEDYKPLTNDMSDDERTAAEVFNKDLEAQIRGRNAVKKPMYRYRVVDEINIHNEGRIFKFSVKTVEATKLLELVQCDTLTFTRKLGHQVDIRSIKINYNYDNVDSEELINKGIVNKRNGTINGFESAGKQSVTSMGDFFTPIEKNSIFIVPPIRWYWNALLFVEVYLCNLDSGERNKLFDYQCMPVGVEDRIPPETERSFTITQPGSYRLEYSGRYYKEEFFIPVDFSVVETIEDEGATIPRFAEMSITDVLERILRVGETRRDGIEQQRFILDYSIKDKYTNTLSPEFCITRATYWEALKMVAGHVHCIPRLNWDETTNSFRILTFDELGQMEECELKAMHNNMPIAWDVRKSLDSYCGEINTYVDNLVNTKDEAMGCIVEPYAGGWKSARASDGELLINNDTVIFKLSRPNMRVSKLEIKYGDKEADITKYLFEAAEYKTLSTFEGSYPNSVAYALKYEQGGTEISEIATICKNKVGFSSGQAFETEAIVNIAKVVHINLTADWYKDIFYRVTYTPIISARIIQDKPYLSDCNGYSRNYNVAGNTIESEFLGEHLKGAIARIGNDIEYRTYMFERGKDVPKPGTLLDGKYIMKVTTQMSSVRFIKCSLILSSDYNQKNEYVAIDSSIRYYDVSEKQSIERHINYSEKVIIGDDISTNGNLPMISGEAVNLFAKVFSGVPNNEPVSWAWFKGKTKNYGKYIPAPPKAILLPCLSQAEGNSLIFNFACQDNYGVGYGVVRKNTNGLVQSQISYGNVYGELDKLEVILGNFTGLANQLSENVAEELPQWRSNSTPIGLLSTMENALIIDKDSREQLNCTIQLNMIVNRRNIILGSELCKNNPLVTATKERTIACYWLPNKINKLATTIDVSNGAEVQFEVITHSENRKFCLPSVQNNSDFSAKAIAWVDVTGGVSNAKLLIGENISVAVGNLSREIWFNFVSN